MTELPPPKQIIPSTKGGSHDTAPGTDGTLFRNPSCSLWSFVLGSVGTMKKVYRTGDPNPPWGDPNSKLSWYVWQEPRFRNHYPMAYKINRFIEWISRHKVWSGS